MEACVRPVRVQARARALASDLADTRSKLKVLALEAEQALANEFVGRSTRRGSRGAVPVAGQESQAELTRWVRVGFGL